jgi:hypothetical protein
LDGLGLISEPILAAVMSIYAAINLAAPARGAA